MQGDQLSMRRSVVVMRARSAARLEDGQEIRIPITSDVGNVLLIVRTRYSDEGFESSIPRELWVEAQGETDRSLNDAINAYWATANGVIPFFAMITNAPIDDLDVHLAFDATSRLNQHEFFQHFIADEVGLPTHGRGIPAVEASRVFSAIDAHSDGPRLRRACTFYNQALRYLRPGQEIFLVQYLWMAVEALTKVALRKACKEEGCSEDELVH